MRQPASPELNWAHRHLQEGSRVVWALVTSTWGSAPRPIGSLLAATANGDFCGSVSAGCVEASLLAEVPQVLKDGQPRNLRYTVGSEQAWSVGLACGGNLEVHLRPLLPTPALHALHQAVIQHEPVAYVCHLHNLHDALLDPTGAQQGDLPFTDQTRQEVLAALTANQAGPLPSDPALFVRPFRPDLRLIVVGAVHITQCLLPMAQQAGFQTVLIDPRKAWATPERFPNTQLIEEWPDQALAQLHLDASTALVTLSHDPKLDDPALIAGLKSPVYYLGALGSRTAHQKRLARLGTLFDQETLTRIHGPVGLDLGSKAPAHIAVSILAHLLLCYHRPAVR